MSELTPGEQYKLAHRMIRCWRNEYLDKSTVKAVLEMLPRDIVMKAEKSFGVGADRYFQWSTFDRYMRFFQLKHQAKRRYWDSIAESIPTPLSG